MNEFDFIEYLKKKMPRSGQVCVGIGDDAAVLNATPGKQLVVSTDVVVDGVDFKIKKGVRHHFPKKVPDPFLSPEKIGRKVLAINLSDLAAMGAKPVAFVITVGKPKSLSTAWLKRFYDGLLKLAKEYDVPCVGGDFSSSKEFFASVTIFGEASPDQVVKRSGAKLGDWIAVTGTLGGSLMRHHHDFTPRIREGMFLANRRWAHAMIDISDGLVQDLSHILKASKVGAVLDLDKIPVSRDAEKMSLGNEEKARARALSDGEDFELLFTASPRNKVTLDKEWKKKFPRVPLSWIGRIGGKVSQISWRRNGKKIAPPKLSQKGFSHF